MLSGCLKSALRFHHSKMDSSFVKALNIISNISPREKKMVGDIMIESGIISTELVYIHNGEVTLFHDDDENQEIITERWRKILSFIGLIQNLKTENLIFLHPISLDNWVYGKDLNKFEASQIPNEYNLSNNTRLIVGPDGLHIKKEDKDYSDLPINSDISKALSNYIVCSIYPGTDYAKFRERGYITPMEYSLKLSRKANNWAIGALLIAIISFLLSPFLFNWFGYSTIKDSQFEQLLDSISRCTQPSSSVTLIYDTVRNHNDSSLVSSTKNQTHVLGKKQK